MIELFSYKRRERNPTSNCSFFLDSLFIMITLGKDSALSRVRSPHLSATPILSYYHIYKDYPFRYSTTSIRNRIDFLTNFYVIPPETFTYENLGIFNMLPRTMRCCYFLSDLRRTSNKTNFLALLYCRKIFSNYNPF